MRRFARARLAGLAAAAPLIAAGAIAAATQPASAASTATVSVNAGQTLATIPSTGVGINVAVYDSDMNGSAIPGLLKSGGFGAVRYPGGSYADGFHWQTDTMTGGGYVAPNTSFDTYMGTVRAAGAQPIITANYGSGTPQEAAAWVQYANVTKGYGVKYWEVGNEVYGNGEYGATWETDNHSSHSATTYATNLLQYISAMKAVDPTIKIGAVLTTPGGWPNGIVGAGDTMDWNHTVLSIAGPKIDFVIVHHYPNSTSEADLLGKPQAEIPGMASTLRSLINQYAGTNAPNVGIAVTEANANAYKDTAPNGLFAPDEYLTWMENGAFTLDWWDMHNGTDCSQVTTVDGATDYNDGGMLSSGAGNSCEPPQDTPFPAYYGAEMISKLGSAGDKLVAAGSSTSLLSAHAVKRANGDLDVMLINKDPDNDATVSLSYRGFTPSTAAPTVYSYLKNATSIGSATNGSAGTQTVPAYSTVVVQLHPGSGGSPSTSASATTSPTPSPSPSSTPSQSPSASPSSTPSTGAGGCKVGYTKTEWPGGLTANVTITNTSGAAVNGWTLAFTFPGDTRVTNPWNASVTQSGSAVRATNVSYNAAIPAGGNVSFGFNGSWTSNDANPTAFTLNGAACATG